MPQRLVKQKQCVTSCAKGSSETAEGAQRRFSTCYWTLKRRSESTPTIRGSGPYGGDPQYRQSGRGGQDQRLTCQMSTG